MRRSIVPTLVIVALVGACAPRPADLEAARAALRAADSGYSQTAVAKNVDAFVGLYEAGATMYPPGEATAQGTDAIRAVVETFLKDPAFAVTFTPVVVDVAVGGDLGYTLNTAAITVTGPDGKPATERIRDFHVWRKQADGSWKVVVDIWNAEPAAPSR